MDSAIFLWGSGDGQDVASLSPESLAQCHPGWMEDVFSLGPWAKLEDAPLFGSGRTHFLWRSSQVGSTGPVLVSGRCSTSMDVAWALDRISPLPDWASVITVEQTAGRGRWHRKWLSPPGNLYVTWIWPEELDKYGSVFGIPELLSLVVAYILIYALQAFNVEVQVKWPNDLFWKGHKIGGVLIERKQTRTMVGIGLNLVSAPPNDALRREGAPLAALLAQAGLILSPLSGWLELSRLAKRCVEEQIRHLTRGEFINLVEESLVGIGQRVVVQTEREEPFTAMIEGLAPDGGLILERGKKQFVLYSGSILFDDGRDPIRFGMT